MKQFVFVCGVDYEFKGLPFMIALKNRIRHYKLLNKSKEEIVFHVFDFSNGLVTTTQITYPSGTMVEKIIHTEKYDKVSIKSYTKYNAGGTTKYRFKPGQYGTLSILDVYKRIIQIGKEAPNSLFELSFFSHGWMGGPILVNSFDDRTVTIPIFTISLGIPDLSVETVSLSSESIRDPDDRDPRTNIDFVPPTMDAIQLSNFQKAFDSNGHIWLWGCAFPSTIHRILLKMERDNDYRDTGLGDDDIILLINLSDEQVKSLEEILLPILKLPFPDKRNIPLMFRYIKVYFHARSLSTYAFRIAKAANIKTYAALVGTASIFDNGNMRISRRFPFLTTHTNFYRNYLKFGLDPEGKGYGEYTPDDDKKVLAHS